MKKLSIHLLLIMVLLTSAIRCSTGASLLKAGSPLLSSLGNIPGLSSITKLLQTPGLGNLLGGVLKKPFTLLAPTDNALSGLGADAVNNLTNPNNVAQLANLLKDHIIPGKKDAAALASGATAASGKALDLAGAGLGNLVAGDKFNIIPVDKVLGK